MHQLQGERNQALAIVANMSEGVVALDEENRILLANNSARNLFEVDGIMEGRRFHDVALPGGIPQAVLAAISRDIAETIETGDVLKGERVLRIGLTPIARPDSLGHAGTVLVISDITEARRAENLSRELVANASHELRTPLAIAGSSADTLLADVDALLPDGREFVEIISRQVHRMENLVDEILQLSRLEVDRPGESAEVFDLNQSVAQVCAQQQDHAARRNVNLSFTPAAAPVDIMGLEHCISMAVSNLVNNAICYGNENGDVRIRISTDHVDLVTISVEDNGPGIPPVDRKRIFERFVRGEQASTAASTGSGLGLAIVARVAQLHGGTVEAKAAPTGGSLFLLQLPLKGVPKTRRCS